MLNEITDELPIKFSKVLLIAPEFYTYHNELLKAFNKISDQVVFYSEMKQTILYRLSCRLSKSLKIKLEKQHTQKLLKLSKNGGFEAVFIVRGACLTSDVLSELKKNISNATFYLYQWDSYQQNDYRPIISFFDSVSTFDSQDAEELKLKYEPLFYSDVYRDISEANDYKPYDLVFYGAYHSDRLTVIKHFEKLLSEAGLVFKSHLYIKKIPLLFRLLKREISFSDLRFFKTYSVSASEIAHNYAKTKAVLDIELSIQSGLSIRTFEVLGSGVKLITTNVNIIKETFYNSEQIMVIDRNNINANLSFFTSSSKDCDIAFYHIDTWLQRILKSAY
ncbi:hypothetical protein CWB58_13670 [Pseudoalteromonas sp. S201]|uniref:hypothetical protein n=1 Tax=Pseudoalteromonas sp. S201 TaxID=579519 RepID=UPI00110CCEF4|nr:hypothetical protein [Pseudoalteromonas sp. S201]TMS92563.1 hypothetical protein CWB58_13670 [Pseudoalteromonas sp. S201]